MTLPKRSEGPPSWACVGAKVCCIKKGGWENVRGVSREAGPTYGQVVEITAVFSDPIAWLMLAGFRDGYAVKRFRPLITLEADLEAHFTTLLHQPVSSKEPA